LPLVAGLKTSATRVIVQVAGSGYRISARNLISVFDGFVRRCERVWRNLGKDVGGNSRHKIAACNRLHNANQRLARWLLMSQDRFGR